jgi:glycosyltransferase involved in cell wall biosynthesis
VGYLLDKFKQPSQTFISGEIEELRRQGVEVHVVTVRRGAEDPGDADVLSDLHVGDLTHLRAHLAWALRSPRRYVRFWRLLLGPLRSETVRGGGHIPARWLPYVASRFRAAGVTRLHAHFAWEGAACAYALSTLTGLPWSMTLHANDIFARRRNLEVKLAAADDLVTVCSYNARYLRDELLVTSPVHEVVCGVTLPAGSAREPSYDVVTAGRLVDKKGVDTLLDAIALMRRDRPGIRALVIGDGPLRDALTAQRATLGLADNVEFAGARPHDEVLAAIASARVFVLAARIAPDGDRDSMPVVVKEAMASGVPVVASDVVGIPEMVDDAVGRLVPVDDAAALAAAITHVLDLPEARRRELGARGRERVAERFTLSAEVARLREVLLVRS